MKRSVRHGIAIFGMAGGMLLLGQAVASADTAAESTTAATTVAATHGTTGGGSATSKNTTHTSATQATENTGTTGGVHTGGNTALSGANTGVNDAGATSVSSGEAAGDAHATVATGDAHSTAMATSGHVTGSNNPSVGNGQGGDVTATSTTHSTTATTGVSGGSATSTDQTTTTAVDATSNAAMTGDVHTGGNMAISGANTGLNGAGADSVSGGEATAGAHATVATGDAHSTAMVTSGHVTGSNNPSVGNGQGGDVTATSATHSTTATTGGSGSGGSATSTDQTTTTAVDAPWNSAMTGDTTTGGNTAVSLANTGFNVAFAAGYTARGDNHVDVLIMTGDAHSTAMATSGHVTGSNNPSVGNGQGGDVTATSTTHSTTATTGGSGSGGSATSTDRTTTTAVDAPWNSAMTGDVHTGGNTAVSGANTGFNQGHVYCFTAQGDNYCSVVIMTGDATSNAMAGSGSVSNANNPSVGNTTTSGGPGSQPVAHEPVDKDMAHKDMAHGDMPKKAMAHKDMAHKAAHQQQAATTKTPAASTKATAAPATSRYASAADDEQDSGELAYTGADVTAPLALGLLALGAGAGLTLAGRRQTTTV